MSDPGASFDEAALARFADDGGPAEPLPRYRGGRRQKVDRRRGLTRSVLGRRASVMSEKQGRRALAAGAIEYPPVDVERPRTRGECRGGARPCPWVACRHHLYLEVTAAGSIKLVFPDREPEDMDESCSLDVAERGGATLEDVGRLTNVVRERTRQEEVRALLKLKMASPSPDEIGAALLRRRGS